MTRVTLALSIALLTTACTEQSGPPPLKGVSLDSLERTYPAGVSIGQLSLGDASDTRYAKGAEVLMTKWLIVNNTATEVTFNSITTLSYGDDQVGGTFDFVTFPSNHFTSCRMEMKDGTLIAGPDPFDPIGQTIHFRDQFSMNAQEALEVYVSCDSLPDPLESGNADAFAMTIQGDYAIDVEDIYGTRLPDDMVHAGGPSDPWGDPGVNSDFAQNIRLYPHGTLECRRSAASPGSKILLGGYSGATASVFECIARGEDLEIERLRFSNCLSGDGVKDPDCQLPQNRFGEDALLSSVYVNIDGMIGVNTFPVGGYVDAAFFPRVQVFKDQPFTIDVRVDLVRDGTYSGDLFQLNLEATPGYTKAIGSDSGEVIKLKDPAYGSPHMMRMTVPVFSHSCCSPEGAGFVPGMQEVLRYNLAAIGNDIIVPRRFTVRLESTDNDGSGWNTCANLADPAKWDLKDLTAGAPLWIWDMKFYDPKGDPCSYDPTHSLRYVEFEILDHVIPAGDTHVFTVDMDSTGASASSNDSIQLFIDKHTQSPFTPIVWDDGGYDTHINGYKVQALPIRGGAIQF